MIRGLIAAAAVVMSADVAFAQPRFEAAGGLSWLGGHALGSRTATLRRNDPGTATPAGFTLFAVDANVERALGGNARFGVALGSAFSVEVGGGYAHPAIAASVSDDAESDPVILADQRLEEFIVEGSLLWRLPIGRSSLRFAPYVIGGAGYLRQIDDDRTSAESGVTGHVGAGLRYWLSGNRLSRRAVGLRAEMRLQVRSGGFEFEDKRRASPALHLLGFVAF